MRTGQVAGQVVEPPTLYDPEVPLSHRLDIGSTPKITTTGAVGRISVKGFILCFHLCQEIIIVYIVISVKGSFLHFLVF